MPLFTQGRALLIGVGAYQDPNWAAPVTATEAEAVAAALTDPAVSAYPPNQVRVLANHEATRDRLLTALQELAGQTTQTDTVLLYFCGHGALSDEGEYHFATQDTVFTPAGTVRAGTGLSRPELLSALAAIKPQKLLFLINACFSGHVTSTLGRGKVLGAPPAATLGMEILATGEGRALITASRPSQYSYYLNTDQYTYFGQALLEGLRGASVPNTGGYIGLYELYQHIYRSVRARAESQEPMLTILQGVGPFPVAHYPGATPQALGEGAIQQTPPRGMAVEEVEKSVVVAVGRGAQAWNVGAGSAVDVDQSRNVVSFGRNNTFGNVTMGDVAGRDLIKVTAAQAAGPSGRQELLDLISQLRDDLARLEDAPEGKREDADDELRKAMEAGEKGDGSRLKEKLEAAQRIVLALSATVPAAVKLGAVIGTALQRAMSLFE